MDDIGLTSWRHHVVWIQCSEDESHQVWHPNNIWCVAQLSILTIGTTDGKIVIFPDIYFIFWGLSEDSVLMITVTQPDYVPLMTGCRSGNTLADLSFIVRFSGFRIPSWLKLVSSIKVVPCSNPGLFHCIAFLLLPFLDYLYLAWLALAPLPLALAWAIGLCFSFLFLAYIFTFTGFSRATISKLELCSCFAVRHQVAERKRDWLRSISSTVCLHDGSYQTTFLPQLGWNIQPNSALRHCAWSLVMATVGRLRCHCPGNLPKSSCGSRVGPDKHIRQVHNDLFSGHQCWCLLHNK